MGFSIGFRFAPDCSATATVPASCSCCDCNALALALALALRFLKPGGAAERRAKSAALLHVRRRCALLGAFFRFTRANWDFIFCTKVQIKYVYSCPILNI